MKISIQFALTVFGLTASVLLVHLSVSCTESKDQIDLSSNKVVTKLSKTKTKFNDDSGKV